MTSSQATQTNGGPAEHSQASSWGDVAFSLAGQIAGLAANRRGDVAALRRMDPDDPDAGAFWRLMAQHGLLGKPDVERKWALVIHGIALMTPTSSGDGVSRTAHDGYTPVGRALFLGSEDRRAQGFYSEMRLNRLLTARGPMLRTLLARMFRMLAAAGVSFNWREMAAFILNEGNDEAVEEGRHRIARAYYQAERRNAPAPEDGSI